MKMSNRLCFRAATGRTRAKRTANRSIILTLGIALFCWLSIPEATAAPPVGVSESGSIDGFEAKFIDVKGVRTRYYDEGSGEPMVLIHGAGAPLLGMTSANTWTPVIGYLATRFHVYAPDKLGSGMTGEPADPNDLTIAGEVQHIYDFVQALGLEKIHLIGQSRGGGLAFLFAVKYSELLNTLVIVDSSTASPTAGDDRRRRWEIIFSECPLEPVSRWVCQYKALSYKPENVDELFVASSRYMLSLRKRQTVMSPEGRRRNNVVTSKMNHDAYHRIMTERVLQMPVLIYWGKNDPSVLPVQGYSLFNIIAEHNPKARMLFTNKAGHFHYREYPEEFSHNIIGFVDYWMGRTAMKAASSGP